VTSYFETKKDAKAGFDKLAKQIYNISGIVLQENKVEMVVSRLRKRMSFRSVETLGDYAQLLKGDDENNELNYAISALTTNVSSFFRERHHFKLLEQEILNRDYLKNGDFRLWSAGCSNGQEAYSLAITLLEHKNNININNIKILATDIDSEVVCFAQKGIYTHHQIDNIPGDILSKYFIKKEDGSGEIIFEVQDEVKRLVHFKILNLFDDWPMKQTFEVIFCRNVVIYFDSKTQKSLWPKFHTALSEHGFIAVGHSERIDCSSFQSFGPTAYKKATL
jgi:chemotaxis protein methyltransferase CheR